MEDDTNKFRKAPVRLVESSWSMELVQLLGLLDSVWQWEFQVLGQELLDVLSLDVVGLLQFNNLQDVDVSKSSSVSSSQVLVHGLNSTDSGNISVLLVHVVNTGSRLVSDPDTVGLNLGRGGLRDQVNRNDLTGSLLSLVQLLQEVPVSRLGHNGVGSEDSHSEQLWLWDSLRWETTTNNLILVQSRHLKLLVGDKDILALQGLNILASSVTSTSPGSTHSNDVKIFASP